jgi:beta-lactamase regulating signal transducer with metallopeptidase domain
MDMIQALSILCPEEKTEDGLKKAYRAACLKHHPDKGGNEEIMKLVNAAYDFLKKCESWWTGEQARQAKKQTPLTETMQAIIDKIKGLAGIKIEIIGSWLWVSGLTYNHTIVLKACRMRFSGNKKAWYYHEDAYRKRSKKSFDLNDIRIMHGSETVETGNNKSIAA